MNNGNLVICSNLEKVKNSVSKYQEFALGCYARFYVRIFGGMEGTNEICFLEETIRYCNSAFLLNEVNESKRFQIGRTYGKFQ